MTHCPTVGVPHRVPEEVGGPSHVVPLLELNRAHSLPRYRMKDTGRQRGHITGSYTTIDKRKRRVSKESFSLKQGRFLERRELKSMSQIQSSSPSDPLRNACPRPTLSAQKISVPHTNPIFSFTPVHTGFSGSVYPSFTCEERCWELNYIRLHLDKSIPDMLCASWARVHCNCHA